MAALAIADFFILERDMSDEPFDAVALALWIGGFALYRWPLAWSLPVGNNDHPRGHRRHLRSVRLAEWCISGIEIS